MSSWIYIKVFKSEFKNIIAFFLKVFLNFDNHTFLVSLRCLPSVEENWIKPSI